MTNTQGTFTTCLKDFWDTYLTWIIPFSVKHYQFKTPLPIYNPVDNSIVLGVPP